MTRAPEPAAEAAPATQDAPASLDELVRYLWRARMRLLLAAALGLVLALALGALRAPRFRARASILIQQEDGAGLLGDLAMLAALASAPATESELAVLESRTLAAAVVTEGRDAEGRWTPHDERHLGLTTTLADADLRPLALLVRSFAPRDPAEPLVLPPRGLFARARPLEPDAPTRVVLELLDGQRVRLAQSALLGLGTRAVEEHTFTPRTPFVYQSLELELEPFGEVAGTRFVLEWRPEHEALRRFQEQLSVRETALHSGVLEVAFEDGDPRRAARVVNALCALYLDSLAARGRRRAARTVEYVQGLLEEEFRRFALGQERIFGLQLAQPELIAPESSAGALIDQMSALEVERVQLGLARHTLEGIVAALGAGDRAALARLDGALAGGVPVDPLTSGLLEELARLDAEAGTLGADLLDEHPLLARNDAASAALLARVRAQLESRLAGLAARAEELGRAQGELRARLGEMPSGLRELAEARIELGIHDELVPYLIKSLQGAEMTRAGAETRAERIDVAVPPDRLAAPDVPRLALLGALLGLALGIGVVLAREAEHGRVHRADELARALGAEGVVALPRLGPVLRDASEGAGALRALRGRLARARDGSARRALGVAPLAAPSEAVALAKELAAALAREGRNVLLVEASTIEASAGATLGPALGLPATPGLARHLFEGTPWDKDVRVSENGPAVLQWGGTEGVEPAERLARPTAARFLAEAVASYEVVVVSLPAAEGLLGAPELVRALDALCLVHRARTRPRAELARTAAALRALGARALLGVLVEKRA